MGYTRTVTFFAAPRPVGTSRGGNGLRVVEPCASRVVEGCMLGAARGAQTARLRGGGGGGGLPPPLPLTPLPLTPPPLPTRPLLPPTPPPTPPLALPGCPPPLPARTHLQVRLGRGAYGSKATAASRGGGGHRAAGANARALRGHERALLAVPGHAVPGYGVRSGALSKAGGEQSHAHMRTAT